MRKFTEYISRQFGNPTGLVGKICCIIMNAINKAMYKSVLSKIKVNQDSKVLDIGYGNGYLIHEIYDKYQPYISGIDISEDMTSVALEKNHRAREEGKLDLRVGDCCNLPFEAETFDVVTSVNTIYFWNDTYTGLTEIYRVLRENGSFINVVYSKEWLKTLSYTKTGFEFFDKEELVDSGIRAGFSEVTIEDIVNGKSYIVIYKKS